MEAHTCVDTNRRNISVASSACQGVKPFTSCSGSDADELDFVKGETVTSIKISAQRFPRAIFEIVPVFGPDTRPIQIGKATYFVEKVGRATGGVAAGENDAVLNQQCPVKKQDSQVVSESLSPKQHRVFGVEI